MHLILSDNTSSKSWNTRLICGWCLGVFSLNQGSNLCFSTCSSGHTLARRMDLSEIAFYLRLFLNSRDWTISLFLTISIGATLGAKKELDKYPTRPINPLFTSQLRPFRSMPMNFWLVELPSGDNGLVLLDSTEIPAFLVSEAAHEKRTKTRCA